MTIDQTAALSATEAAAQQEVERLTIELAAYQDEFHDYTAELASQRDVVKAALARLLNEVSEGAPCSHPSPMSEFSCVICNARDALRVGD